jgi:PAS domain S-box-containing protein
MSQTAESMSAALAGSRELLETVLRHLSDGIVVTAAGGERLYANDEAARLTGYPTADELMVAGLEGATQRFEILRPDGSPLASSELPARRALAGEDPEPMLVRFRATTGGPDRISLVRAVPIRDEAGALAYVISIFREVTGERVLAERERVSAGAAEVLNATLDYEGILDAIARFAVPDFADGCAVHVVEDGALRRAAVAGELSPEDSVCARVVDSGEPQLAGSSMCVPLRSGRRVLGAILFESQARRYDENDLLIAGEIAARAVAAIDNSLIYLEARRTSALLDSLYGSAPIGLGFWDRDLRYVRVNEALARINNRPADDHPGRTLAEVIPHLAHVLEPIARRVLETREAVIALEMTGGTPDAPDAARHWLASYYPVLAPDGEPLGVGAIVEEITLRRRAEQRAALQYTVTRILADAETVDAAVPLVLETVCEALQWDVAAYWPVDQERQRVVWSRPGVQLHGFTAMTERVSMTPATLPGRVAASGEAEWLERLTPDRFARASVAAAEGLAAGVAFPILVEGQVVGVLEAFSSTPRARDDELLQSLAALGGQLGQFLSRKRAEDDRAALFARERNARAEAESAAATLRSLEGIAEVALEHLRLEDLLQALLARIVEVLDADTSAILLVGDDGKLTVRAQVGLAGLVEHAIPVPIGAGLAGGVAARRAALLVPDLSQVELVSPVLRERGVNSLVAIPLIVDDEVIGVVHVGSEAFAQFDESDARLLELIADRIALAINQASLYEAERAAQERLRFLSEASIVLASSLDLDVTLHRAAALAVTRFADAAIVDLVQGDAIARVVIEVADPSISGPIREGLLANPPTAADTGGSAKVIRTGQPEILLDLDADPSPLEDVTRGRPAITSTVDLLKPRSLVYMPLIARGHTLGVLALIRTTARFDQRDVETVRELAARIAVAVDNANLYREAERGRARLGFLAEASALLGSTLDVESTLDDLSSLVAGSAADWCAIHLRDESGRAYAVAVAHRDPVRTATARAELATFPATREPPTMVSRVIESGEPVLVSEADVSLPETTFEREEGVHSGMVVPLVARGRALGSLSFVRAETTESYTPEDLEFAVDLARRTAVALDNAQLFRASEERAQAARVLASVGDGVFLVDRHGLVRTWNRAAVTATGLPEADVIDRAAVEAIPGWASVVARVPMSSEGTGAAPRAESLPLDLGGRELWLSIHGVAVPDGIVYAFRDLTEERALEAMRTEFVSTVSHELRTPLAAIYGAAMTLRRSDVTLADEQRANLLDVVSAEADRLARTVNDILWASRLDTDALHVSIQNCDPLALARDVVEAQRAHLGRAHEIVLLADAELPQVAGDPDKVGRVLINLVDNAVKYSPDGGAVTVAVATLGAHVRFSITDQGLGIPLSEQRRIFDKFYRLDPNMNRGVGGTGLGLYICRELVRRMDGRIWVESSGLGAGSTFAVELPAAGDFSAHISGI